MKHMTTDGNTPERLVPYGIVNIDVAIMFLIRLRVEEIKPEL
jgi:hypothetical protein